MSIENKIVCHQQQNLRHQNNLNFEPRIWKVTISEINFGRFLLRSIFLLYFCLHEYIAKSKVTLNSAGTVNKLPYMFTRETKDTSVSKWWQATGFLFLLVWFFFLWSVLKIDKKCANSTQRSQSLNSWGWPLFLLSQNFTLLGEVIYPGNSIVLEIAAALLFISVTNSFRFWGSFCWNSSTLPTDLFTFVSYVRAAGLLSARTYTLTLLHSYNPVA